MNKYAYTLFGFIKMASQPQTPITMADLDKVDSKTMQKYHKLTGARNMNSKMDRWKTLMAMRHGKNWDKYSNDEYKSWLASQQKPQSQGIRIPQNQLTFNAPADLTPNIPSVGGMKLQGNGAPPISSLTERRLRSQLNNANLQARNYALSQLGDPMPQIPDRPATDPRKPLTPLARDRMGVDQRRLNSQATEGAQEARNYALSQLVDPMPQIPDRPATDPRKPLTPTVEQFGQAGGVGGFTSRNEDLSRQAPVVF